MTMLTRPRRTSIRLVAFFVALTLLAAPDLRGEDHPILTWVKRHPREPGAAERLASKPSPRMGYECSYAYDPRARLLLRYGGHNQGGGGEQNSELWTYDLDCDAWDLREPDDAPPGVCCAQQHVFDPVLARFVRFPSFSASHGWQSRREVWLKDSSVWLYDLAANRWRDRRPLPAPEVRPLRGAAYDPRHGVIVVHGGEGASHSTVVYDPGANRWHWMRPEPAPEASVSQPGFAFDQVHGVFVLFGSQFGSDSRTWIYDLRRNEWRVLEVAGGVHPPADKTSPVLAADTRAGVVLAVIDVDERREGEKDGGDGDGDDGARKRHNETWVLDVAKPAWRRLELAGGREPDASGPRNRNLVFLEDRNLFVLENRTRDEQQVWTFRYAEAGAKARETGAAPAPPHDVSVETTEDSAVVSWKAPTGAGAGVSLRYVVERGVGELPWQVDYAPIARDLAATRYEDRELERGKLYHYRVRAVRAGAGGNGAASEPSIPRRAQPPVVEDVVVSVVSETDVLIEWPAPPAPGAASAAAIAGYHVERADVQVRSSDELEALRERYRPTSDLAAGRIERIGPFRRLAREPIAERVFVDAAAALAAEPGGDAHAGGGEGDGEGEAVLERSTRAEGLAAGGKPYRFRVRAYRVVAVNRLGVAGGPSAPRFTYPRAVRNAFAKEVGEAETALRWEASPERGIRGYLVYRHDGRWDKDTITRLTPEPIRELTFIDAAAGDGTRRYEVVAVDALGQEGEPSQPVWSRREWARFYVPYVGEWHQ
jgi:hypothetical protein